MLVYQGVFHVLICHVGGSIMVNSPWVLLVSPSISFQFIHPMCFCYIATSPSNLSMHANMQACKHASMHACLYIYTYIYIYICAYSIYIYTYIYTYIHICQCISWLMIHPEKQGQPSHPATLPSSQVTQVTRCIPMHSESVCASLSTRCCVKSFLRRFTSSSRLGDLETWRCTQLVDKKHEDQLINKWVTINQANNKQEHSNLWFLGADKKSIQSSLWAPMIGIVYYYINMA